MPRVIWCLGMYASASTWLFNVAQKIHFAAGGGDLRPGFFSGKGDFSGFGRPGVTDIVKSHEITDEGTVLELAGRTEKMFVTMRDPRDAVTSLMLYHSYTFEKALPLIVQAATLCMDFAKDKRALFLHYESGFFDKPETVMRVAGHLGYALTDEQAAEIFNGMNRAAVEKYIAEMPKLSGILQDRVSGDRLDPRTHWHTHHAGRDGEMGRWRHMLADPQADEVVRKLAGVYEFL
jgi:hypothetical protein